MKDQSLKLILYWAPFDSTGNRKMAEFQRDIVKAKNFQHIAFYRVTNKKMKEEDAEFQRITGKSRFVCMVHMCMWKHTIAEIAYTQGNADQELCASFLFFVLVFIVYF